MEPPSAKVVESPTYYIHVPLLLSSINLLSLALVLMRHVFDFLADFDLCYIFLLIVSWFFTLAKMWGEECQPSTYVSEIQLTFSSSTRSQFCRHRQTHTNAIRLRAAVFSFICVNENKLLNLFSSICLVMFFCSCENKFKCFSADMSSKNNRTEGQLVHKQK